MCPLLEQSLQPEMRWQHTTVNANIIAKCICDNRFKRERMRTDVQMICKRFEH